MGKKKCECCKSIFNMILEKIHKDSTKSSLAKEMGISLNKLNGALLRNFGTISLKNVKNQLSNKK